MVEIISIGEPLDSMRMLVIVVFVAALIYWSINNNKPGNDGI